jgi:hypothetical protein
MTYLTPLTDEQKRKRRPDGRVLDDGEAVHFDITLRDAAPAGTASQFLTDAEYERAVLYQVDYEHGAHDAKFAFMGNLAPKFDRANAEFLARNRLMNDAQKSAERSKALAAARYDDAARAAAATGLNAWRGGPDAVRHQDAVANAASLRDALRTARYSAE